MIQKVVDLLLRLLDLFKKSHAERVKESLNEVEQAVDKAEKNNDSSDIERMFR